MDNRGGSQAPEKRKAGGHAVNLEDVAEHWAAPNVPNGGRSTAHAEQVGKTLYHDGKKVQMGLESQAQNWPSPMAGAAGTEDYNAAGNSDFSRKAMELAETVIANWAAPTVRIHKGSSEGSILRQDGKSRADQLDYQAEQFFRPPSSPGRPIIAAGSTCSTDTPNTNQPSVKRKLNPIFVEALMRWPTGLSGFERPETAWTRWWQLMPTFLSTLVSPQIEAEQQLELL